MENQPCYHCGEDCGKHPIVFDQKPFCCSGCSSVYQILGQGKLYKYYELENTPGQKIETNQAENQYAALDNEEIQAQLLDFDDGQNARVGFFVPNIHCASCIWLLENMHRLNKGVSLSTVNFVKKTVSISFRKNEISLRQLAELMDSIGYGPKISLEDTQKTAPRNDKGLLYRIGVAGFAFGNIMLMSFPEYLAGGEFTEDHFRTNFAYMNLLLALPIAFYSATGYYVSAWKGLRHRYINIDVPIALGIIVLFLRTAYEVLSQTGPGYSDSLAGLLFFMLVGKWYQNKTYQALSFERDYKSYFPIAVTRLAHDKEEIIPLKQLAKGDRILVRNQELIPADAILKRGQGNIDFSFVTGEASPVRKNPGDTLYAGGRQVGSAIELEVLKPVEQSYLTQLWNQSANSEAHTRMHSMVDTVSHYFTIFVLLLAVATFAYWQWTAPEKAIQAFAAVLIVACPCALALSLPFGFGTSMRLFGRLGFYLKKMEVVEQLTRVDTVVFDKTGTITQSNSVEIQFFGRELSPVELALIKSVTRQSTHPMSTAVSQSIATEELYPTELFSEIPGEGIRATVEKQILKIGSQAFVTGQAAEANSLETKVYVSFNDQTAGYFRVENKYRDGLQSTIARLGQHYQLHLLTGDNAGERERLLQFFPQAQHLHFDQKPADKLAYVQQLRRQGRNVLMVGDGLNDAGALLQSNTGISIADNIHHFSPACDAILDARRFAQLPDLLAFARNSLTLVKLSYGLSFFYNIIGLSIAVSANLSPIVAAILMPISSVTVVSFVTLSTHIIAKRKFQNS